ncbi:MAG TPA: hypothetical protein VF132_04340 [Rudaea sp.]
MIPRAERATTNTALVPPGAALCLSVLMMALAPRYKAWFGDAMPAFSRTYFADYPILIGISAIALASVLIARQFPAYAERCAFCRMVDLLLAIAALLIIAGGIIALFLPVLLRAQAV